MPAVTFWSRERAAAERAAGEGRADDLQEDVRPDATGRAIEKTFTPALRISLVVQPSSGKLPSQSAD